MISFKWEKMQNFIKQTLYPYVVNVRLLIRDSFKHIGLLHDDVDRINYDIENTIKPGIEQNKKDIAANKALLDNHGPRIDALEKKTDQHDKDIAELKKTDIKHTANIEQNAKDIDAIEAKLKEADDKVNKHMKNEIKKNGTANSDGNTNVHETRYEHLKGLTISSLPPTNGNGSNGDVWEQYIVQ